MNLLEYQGKRLLAQSNIAIPQGTVVDTPQAVRKATVEVGARVVLKSQTPTGKRGKAGAILFADTAEGAAIAVQRLLGKQVDGHTVRELLVERCVDIYRELYVAVLNDAQTKGPLLLFSTAGGMDIEEVNASSPDRVRRLPIDIRSGLTEQAVVTILAETDLPAQCRGSVARTVLALYAAYREHDADLVEVNPLVVTRAGEVVALDSKISLDPGARPRHADLVGNLPIEAAVSGTELEQRGRDLGLEYIELDGDVGVLANGAGLTMASLDVVNHYGGCPANFLEIGGDAYTKATPALALVLDNPRIRSLLINFCGAFARTDVMTDGVVTAIENLRPDLPIFFTIHGTGEKEAVQLIRDRLAVEPYDSMDDAVKAAVNAAADTTVEAQ